MKVQPITSKRDIAKIKALLSQNRRDYLLFVTGINTGLRVQDLLHLRVNQVEKAVVGDRIPIKERKTNKENVLIVNAEIHRALARYLEIRKVKSPDEYLFKSRKGRNYPLTTFAVTQMVQRWCDSIGLRINAGAHTLRKTWCYQQRKQYGTSWEVLARRLNHSSPSTTRRYMGVQADEVEEALLREI